MGDKDIFTLLRWAHRAPAGDKREARLVQVREDIFTDDLSSEERERREELVAKFIADPAEAGLTPADDSTPDEVTESGKPAKKETPREKRAREFEEFLAAREDKPKVSKPVEWRGFVPATSKAHKRASRHDGTMAELDAMKEKSEGSPFDAEDEDLDEEPKTTRTKRGR